MNAVDTNPPEHPMNNQTNRRRRTRAATVAAIAATVALSACGSATQSARRAPSVPTRSSSAAVAPSATTKMICADEAQEDIRATLGVATNQPVVPTWRANNYSCRYVYPDGAFALSVQQLPDRAATTRYFTALTAKLGRGSALTGLGDDATTTTSGPVIVRKDDKVLTVDPHDLPARFGKPADTRANVAISIAATIMGCWTGA
jgi:hypothetical protein